MNLLIGLLATGMAARFVYTFLYLFYNRHTIHEHVKAPKHRDAENRRSKHFKKIPIEVITTGDIYSERRAPGEAGVF